MRHSLAAIFIFIICSFQAFGQEADTLIHPRETDRDSIDRWKPVTADSTEFIPLWQSDTLYQVRDTDTLQAVVQAPLVRGDTMVVERIDHSPEKATMFALVLPGLGQIYNKRWWKVPLVYAALGGAGYAIWYNSGMYNDYSKEYALNPDDTNERYLKFWRRNMELSYIAMVAVYALQVVDAYVDAQLFYWDVNEELALGVRPSVQPLLDPNSLTGASVGLTCSINLKGK